MALTGKIFAERQPTPGGKRSGTAEQDDSAVFIGDFTEFGTLPRETIIRLGLRHVYTLPVVLEDNSIPQLPIYRAEVLHRRKWRTVYVQESVDGADEGRRKHGE